jgi:hypothetical protein
MLVKLRSNQLSEDKINALNSQLKTMLEDHKTTADKLRKVSLVGQGGKHQTDK